ncbi:hypothetical protein MHYP_G00281670 [Metynnis hypsauchen]
MALTTPCIIASGRLLLLSLVSADLASVGDITQCKCPKWPDWHRCPSAARLCASGAEALPWQQGTGTQKKKGRGWPVIGQVKTQEATGNDWKILQQESLEQLSMYYSDMFLPQNSIKSVH